MYFYIKKSLEQDRMFLLKKNKEIQQEFEEFKEKTRKKHEKLIKETRENHEFDELKRRIEYLENENALLKTQNNAIFNGATSTNSTSMVTGAASTSMVTGNSGVASTSMVTGNSGAASTSMVTDNSSTTGNSGVASNNNGKIYENSTLTNEQFEYFKQNSIQLEHQIRLLEKENFTLLNRIDFLVSIQENTEKLKEENIGLEHQIQLLKQSEINQNEAFLRINELENELQKWKVFINAELTDGSGSGSARAESIEKSPSEISNLLLNQQSKILELTNLFGESKINLKQSQLDIVQLKSTILQLQNEISTLQNQNNQYQNSLFNLSTTNKIFSKKILLLQNSLV
jgi:cell division protein FtsB